MSTSSLASPAAVDVPLDRLEREPLAVWAELRRTQPVAHLPALGLTVVTRHADVDRVCRDAEVFAAETPDGPLSRTLGPNFMHADGPGHRAVRDLLVPSLRGRSVRESHEPWLRELAAGTIERAAAQGVLDVMADVAHPLAVALLSRITGVVADGATYERWFRAIAAGAGNFENDPSKESAALAAGAEVEEAVRRARDVPGGLVAMLAHAGCSDAQLTSTVKLFVIGGLQEPRDLLGFCALGLLTSGTWGTVGLPGAVEEAARWGSPVGTVTRTARRDVELAGTLVPAGTRVAAVLASANHDEDRWEQPARFDPARAQGTHFAYGSGPHTCVGAALTRVLVRIVLEELVKALPVARLVAPPEIVGYEFRGPRAVLVSPGGVL